MEDEALVPTDLRGLDSLAWHSQFVVYKNGNDLFIVLFYNILFKVLDMYIYVIIFYIEIRLIL